MKCRAKPMHVCTVGAHRGKHTCTHTHTPDEDEDLISSGSEIVIQVAKLKSVVRSQSEMLQTGIMSNLHAHTLTFSNTCLHAAIHVHTLKQTGQGTP